MDMSEMRDSKWPAEIKRAQSFLRDKDFVEAEKILDEMIKEGCATAADLMGIALETGLGIDIDLTRAAQFYQTARRLGSQMAVYHLGLLYYNQGQFDDAFDILKTISDNNPSACYWTYRSAQKKRNVNASEVDTYLFKAASLGHFAAKSIIAKLYMRGKFGMWKIPLGYFKAISSVYSGWRSINNNDKLTIN